MLHWRQIFWYQPKNFSLLERWMTCNNILWLVTVWVKVQLQEVSDGVAVWRKTLKRFQNHHDSDSSPPRALWLLSPPAGWGSKRPPLEEVASLTHQSGWDPGVQNLLQIQMMHLVLLDTSRCGQASGAVLACSGREKAKRNQPPPVSAEQIPRTHL